MEFRGEGSRCLLSLSALVLPAVWMVLPSPAPYLWGPLVCLFLLVVFIYIYIKASDPAPTTHIPTLRLIYLLLKTRLLCFQPLLLPYP